jgi:rhodanese-related sulfurtransferase
LAELHAISKKLIGDSDSLEKVDRKTLLARAKRDEIMVIDVRPRDEYDAAHLPFAISLPLDELKAKLKQLPKDKEIVAYCRGPYCLMAVEAVHLLKRLGFKAIRLDDGVREWRSAGLPIQKRA